MINPFLTGRGTSFLYHGTIDPPRPGCSRLRRGQERNFAIVRYCQITRKYSNRGSLLLSKQNPAKSFDSVDPASFKPNSLHGHTYIVRTCKVFSGWKPWADEEHIGTSFPQPPCGLLLSQVPQWYPQQVLAGFSLRDDLWLSTTIYIYI